MLYLARLTAFVACCLIAFWSLVIIFWKVALDVQDGLARWIVVCILCSVLAFYLDSLKGDE